MTTTWSDFLAELRLDIQDTGTRWTDKILWIYTKDAIRDYSTWFPKRVDHCALTLTDGSYPLPLDFIQEIAVEAPEGTFLDNKEVFPGSRHLATSSPSYYYVQGGCVYLSASSDDVYLTYLACHPVPASETASFTFTIPDADLELIRLYVKAKIYEQLRSRQANLDRFKLGSGQRDDNPVAVEVSNLMAVYLAKIAERKPGGVIYLYKARAS